MQHEIRTLFHAILKPRGTQARMARLLGTTETTVGRWADLGGSPLDSFARFFDALLTANRDGARLVLEWFSRRYQSVPFVGTWTPARVCETFGAAITAELAASGPRLLRDLWRDHERYVSARIEILDRQIFGDDERRAGILGGAA